MFKKVSIVVLALGLLFGVNCAAEAGDRDHREWNRGGHDRGHDRGHWNHNWNRGQGHWNRGYGYGHQRQYWGPGWNGWCYYRWWDPRCRRW